MFHALKNGDLESAMGAMQNLLNSCGAKVQGDKKQAGFESVKGSLSADEASACESTMKAVSASGKASGG